MYAYELYRTTAAELIRRADAERELGRARLARRAARRAGRDGPRRPAADEDRTRFAPAA